MTRQFGRRYRLEIGNDSEGFQVEGLRVAFEISKSIDEKPNPGKISIWNLNRDHINQLLDGSFKNAKLWAGYQDLRVIYQGDLVKTKIKRDGVDFVMELECGDGHVDNQQAVITTTLKSGSKLSDVMNSASGTLKSSVGTVDIPNDKQMPRGQVLNGATRDVFTKLAKDQNANWSIQDGELVFLPYDKVLGGEAPLLSQETGLIGSPEQTDNGLELQCLLNPDLKVGGLVRLESIIEHFNGDYKIVNLSHNGDAIGGDWLTKLTVVGGKFQKVESKK